MNTSLIQDIAYSIMLHAEHDQLPIGTTKLVKLFYLIDVEYFKYHQKTLTGVPWIFYHYGPFANELIDAVQNTDGIEPTQEEFGDYKSFKSYRITGSVQNLSHFLLGSSIKLCSCVGRPLGFGPTRMGHITRRSWVEARGRLCGILLLLFEFVEPGHVQVAAGSPLGPGDVTQSGRYQHQC